MIEPLLVDQGRLIRLPDDRTLVFVGDTHGDVDATRRVLARHIPAGHLIVFLGDAVDRGPGSDENLDLILSTKLKQPESIFLLMGNHEAWGTAPFSPADFWNGLRVGDARALSQVLARLPFAAHHPSGLLAVHGALPDLASIDDIERIALGSPTWRDITWGDFYEVRGQETSAGSGRPAFGREDFLHRTGRLGIRVVVRSHQPLAPALLFDDRCLTVFSSSAYGDGTRRVALLRPGTILRSARDLALEET